MKKIKVRLKSIGPIIAVILLVVVAVILVTILLSFSTGFATKSLDKAGDIKDISKADAGNFVYPKTFSDGVIQFNYSPPSNLVVDNIQITKYKILSNSGESSEVTLTESYTLTNGSNILNLNDVLDLNDFSDLNITDNKIDIQFYTSDGQYLMLKNITNPADTSRGEEESEPIVPCTSGGLGTLLDPIIVCTAEDLNDIRNDLDANYMLGRDIDFFNPAHWTAPPTDIETTTANWNGGAGFIPIGTSASKFVGTIEGNNNTISNLYINRPTTSNVGLFGVINGVLINIGLEDINIIADGYVGGLVGSGSGRIINSYTTGTIVGGYSVGGISGNPYSGEILNCHSHCSINAKGQIGGLVGFASGLVSISNSYATGDITDIYLSDGTGRNGGLVGAMWMGSAINNSYAIGNLIGNGNSDIGGLVGISNLGPGYIINSYSIGAIPQTGTNIGGLIGSFGSGSILNSYWDMDTSGKTTSAGGLGKTSFEMKLKNTFVDWDFDNVWNITEGTSNPYIIATSNPVIISTPADLNNVRKNLGGYYILDRDIDLNISPYKDGTGWDPIGNNLVTPFFGIFDGNGHKINNLYINKPTIDNVGLFGTTIQISKIKNLGLNDVNITGNNNVGSLFGYNGATVFNCYSSGVVSGKEYVGGLVGQSNGGTMNNNYSLVNVVRSSGSAVSLGGFLGQNTSGTFTNNYSKGSVSGNSWTPTNRGFSGTSVTGSGNFWDMNTSGQLTSGGGTGKTTIQMKQEATFVGWTFPGTWSITEGTTYPYLTSNVQSPLPQ